jgi:AcrR family transcriptional regulator
MMVVMAISKSEMKRRNLLNAATRVIAAEGLSASTAAIAKEASVASGSLFIYFKTKSVLFNELFLDLKSDWASAAIEGVRDGDDLHSQLLSAWTSWMSWAVANPEKRRALAQLSVSDEITAATHAVELGNMSTLSELMDRARAMGSMQNASLELAVAIINSMAEATMDVMVREPSKAKEYSQVGFDALWRVLN